MIACITLTTQTGGEAVAAPVSARQVYLETIGLTRSDPFSMPVAEQELAFSMESRSNPSVGGLPPEVESKPPASFEYFCPPPLSGLPVGSAIPQVLRKLREPGVTFIYGPPGAGKTTLRLALEANYRREPDHTLVISYPLIPDLRRSSGADTHWNRLAEALAVDLVIQVIEQFNPLDPAPTPEQINTLQTQIAVGGRGLNRLIERILDEPEPKALVRLGLLWPSVDRFAVRRILRSPALVQLLQTSIRTPLPSYTRHTGEDAVRAGLRAARSWGFDKAAALVDGVDTPRRDQDFMLELIRPLIDALPHWEMERLNFKFFLPLILKEQVAEARERLAPDLTAKPFESIIGPWDRRALQDLLKARFRSAGSRRVGFTDLAGAGLEHENLDHLIFAAAEGLPRQLLQVVNCLIDAHAARDPRDPRISLADWAHVSKAFSPTKT